MRIGGYKISGVTRRFWLILAAVIVVFFLLIYFASSHKQEAGNPLSIPAFAVSQLQDHAQKPGWIEPYISYYGLKQPERAQYFTDNYTASVGLPFKFRVYIPSQDVLADRPDLNVSKDGWQFVPAIFLDPDKAVSPDGLTDQQLPAQPLILGFPEGQTPAAGQAYDITGLVYWNSKPLLSNKGQSSPVILAASASPLATTDLENPTTHLADLNIVYQQNNMQLDLRKVEWSSGRQVRVCVALSNVGSPTPLPIWQGLSSFSAEYAQAVGQGSSTGEPDPNSPLATQSTINEGSSVVGYITFDQAPSGAPSSPMTLFVPPLNNISFGGAPTAITIKPPQFTDVSKVDYDTQGTASDGCFQS